jgi:hypothetical protein
MVDPDTNKPVRVSTDERAGSSIMVSVDTLSRVQQLLEDNDVPHWVDHIVVSVDGRPGIGVIHLANKSDPRHVQELLDRTV